MSTSSDNSLPYLPDNDSPGSSVSSSLLKEYEELLKYAVVTPKIQIPKSVYKENPKDQPSRAANGGQSSDDSSKSSSSSDSKASPSDLSQSTYAEDSSEVAKEGVVGLPSSPGVPISISLMGQGSLARDSLLRSDSATTPNGKEGAIPTSPNDTITSPSEDSPSSDQSVESPYGRHSSPAIDADLARMEALLDSWCLDLKRNVLAELAQCKMGLFEKQKQLILQEKRRHMADRNKLLNEMESQKELLYTYEQSVSHKDSIVANMASALQRQRDKFELLKGFSQWKVKHNNETREAFTDKLSQKHYDHKLKAKAWSSWRQLIESQWKNRVEKACQSKSQEVCVKLTEDYEAKLAQANHELEESRREISRLHAERDAYEETMKKAFMRGVCALNLEAMTMFREGEEGGRQGSSSGTSASCTHTPPSDQDDIPRSQAPVPSTTGIPPGGLPGPSSQSAVPYYKPSSQGGGRKITVKATGREDLRGAKAGAGLMGHQGPVSSILVQRHTSEPTGLPSLPPRQPPTTTSMRTTKSRSLPVKTVHTTPLKVVH